MKKPIILSVLFFILTAISSFGQGVWIEENFNWLGKKTGKIEVNGNVYEINSEADLSDANLSGANLSNTYLLRINFTKANLSGANLSGAVLNQVTFNKTDLSKTNFSDAEIGFTRFKGMTIEETNFSGAGFFAATIDNCIFKNVNLLWAESFDFMYFNGQILEDENFSSPFSRIKELEAQLATMVTERASKNEEIRNLQSEIEQQDEELESLREQVFINEWQLAFLNEELSKRFTLDDIQDARNGSVVINSSNGEATLSFNIEESEDLKTWQATGEKINKTVQLKDGKKFYRFALDK